MLQARAVVVLMVVLVCLAPISRVGAQCDTSWEAGPLSAPLLGADGPINAVWSWSLPAQPLQLIVAGDFTHIGGIAANRIAAWDGQVWRALGDGFTREVFALTTYNFSLIAVGEGFISAWNGSDWTNLGTPLPTFNGGQYPNAFAAAVYNGELYVGGDFNYISSDVPGTGRLWKYNGVGPWPWQPVPAGAGNVRALQVFDADGAGANPPELYVGGTGGLRRWNGTSATTIAGPYANTLQQPGTVYALTVVNPIGAMPGGLIVGGSFIFAPIPGGGGNFQVNGVARFDGNNWYGLTNGVSGGVYAVRAFGPDLYVAGNFSSANNGTVAAVNIARYNGSQWFSVGGGVGTVYELREFNGQLVAGGWFGLAGGNPASNLAKWNGGAWSAFSETFSVNALARMGTRIVMGGSFTQATTTSFPAATTNRYNLCTWDLTNEGGLGWGTNAPVRALLSYTTGSGASLTNIVVAGGDFTSCGPDQSGFNIAVNRIALWSEPSLTLPGWNAMGSGFNGSVYALERFQGNVVAGGAFTASGATTTNRLAKYTGSPASWQPLTSPDPGFNGNVWALKSFSDSFGGLNSYLVVGGDFTAAPVTGVAASRIIMRKESPLVGESAWQALGQGFNGSVYAIERYGSGLNARTYAGGVFTASGAVTCNRIARLNGANWEPVGNGIGFNGAVYALKTVGAYLYAAGSFTSVDGIAVNRVAKWNGTAWSDASGGASDIVFAITPYQTELIAGGVFGSVQSGTIASPGMARLKASGVPWIQRQPLSQTRDCMQPVYFDLVLPEGYENATFQWRRNGVPLTDGPTGTGSQVFNAQTSFMNIYYLSPSDNGSYDCVVTNPCGSATSTAATLTVNACCYADINQDDLVNVTDLLAVIGAWGPCANCPSFTCPPDIAPAPASPAGGDCQVNVSDLLAVIGAWGACP